MNGSALATMPLPEPPTTAAPTKDRLDPATLRRIGEITADGVILLADGMQEFSTDGALAAHTRAKSGELFLALYEIQQAMMMTDDFARLMHEHGKAVLWARNPEIFRCHPGTKIDRAIFDRGIGVLVDHLYAVLARIIESERIYALARAN